MGVGEEKQQNLEAQALGENVYLMFPWGKCVLTGGYCGPKKKKKPKKMLPVVLVRDLVRTVVAIKSSTTGAATQTLHREGS